MDKKTLYRLFYLPKQIAIKKREIQRIMERLTAISPSLTGMPHGGGVHDKLGEGVPELVDKKNELEEMVRGYEAEERSINQWIDGIDDIQVNLIMSLRFKERRPWSEVADEAGSMYTDDSVRKMVDRYLEKEGRDKDDRGNHAE